MKCYTGWIANFANVLSINAVADFCYLNGMDARLFFIDKENKAQLNASIDAAKKTSRFPIMVVKKGVNDVEFVDVRSRDLGVLGTSLPYEEVKDGIVIISVSDEQMVTIEKMRLPINPLSDKTASFVNEFVSISEQMNECTCKSLLHGHENGCKLASK